MPDIKTSETSFSLSYSPSPSIKKTTAMLPWNASASLVRRELINLGWDSLHDQELLMSIEVTRSNELFGHAWSITFGDRESSHNAGDEVSLGASISIKSDPGSPQISVTTIQNGKRTGGQNEIQYLQIIGTGELSGFYRLRFDGSSYSPYISSNASAIDVKFALEQLPTVRQVKVFRNDFVDKGKIGSFGSLLRHYEITFNANVGNLQPLQVDASTLLFHQ